MIKTEIHVMCTNTSVLSFYLFGQVLEKNLHFNPISIRNPPVVT